MLFKPKFTSAVLALALACATALPASAATSVYPDGADGGDGQLDATGGFYPESRQLDFDFLLSVFDEYLPAILPAWNTGGTPLWTTVTHQESDKFYGADNDANGIDDHDHLDLLAAIVNGGAAGADGVDSADVAAIQAAFNANRQAVQNRELVFPRVTVTAFGLITVSLNNVATGKSQTVAGNDIALPSLWTSKEIATTGDPTDQGLLAEASPMLEVMLRDLLAAQMTLCPGTGSTEVQHIQSFMNVFLTSFLKTQLPNLLSGLGEVTPRAGNNYNTLDIDLDVTTTDIGTLRVRIAGSTQGSSHSQQAISFFANSFSPSPPTTTWTGAGYGSGTPPAPNAWHDGATGGSDWPAPNFVCLSGDGTLAATGNLDRAGNSNLASFQGTDNRQDFLLAEGISNLPLQFLPIPATVNGNIGQTLTIGDDEFAVLGGDGSELAYDWESVGTLGSPLFATSYEYTVPQLGGVTNEATYSLVPTGLDNGLKLSVQIADDSWTRTLPAFVLSISDGPIEGEGVSEGIIEGTPEGIVEGIIEGTPEGIVEGIIEGTPEGIVEGIIEGTPEGIVEGIQEGEPPLCTYTVQIVGCMSCSVYVDGSFSLGDGGTFTDVCGSSHCYEIQNPDGSGYTFTSWEGEGTNDPTLCTSNQTIRANMDPIIGEGGLEGQPEGILEGTPEGVFEGITEGTTEGTPEGIAEGTPEGIVEGEPEGITEGTPEGVFEGIVEGEGEETCTFTVEIVGCVGCSLNVDGNFSVTNGGTFEAPCNSSHCYLASEDSSGQYVFISWDGQGDPNLPLCTSNTFIRAIYDPVIGEGGLEGQPEGIVEGTPEGQPEGQPEGVAEGIVEGTTEGVTEGTTEGEGEGAVVLPQTADLNGDFIINLFELLRLIQFYNAELLHCDETGEDGYAPGPGDTALCLPHTSDYAPQDWIISLGELLRLIQVYNIGEYYPCDDEGGFCPGIKQQ